MAFKTTRDQRAQRWQIVPSLIAATFAFSAFQFLCASGSMAQIKAPNKNQLKAPTKAGPSKTSSPSPSAPTARWPTSSGLKLDPVAPTARSPSSSRPEDRPADAQAANDAVGKALEQLDTQDHQLRPRRPAIAGRRQAQAAGHPAALFRQVAGRRTASRRRRHLRLQARAQRHRERRRARLQPAQHDHHRRRRRPLGRGRLGQLW